jgi:thymidine phosphorylase
MLEFSGSVLRGSGYEVARDILESGSAWKKMEEMIEAQGKAPPMRLGTRRHVVKAGKSGKVRSINNKAISKLARMAGAPITKGAGLYLHKKVGEKVKKGEPLYTAYADSAEKIRHVKVFDTELKPYRIG